jgi:cyclin-C
MVFNAEVGRLGKRLGIRQQPMATAQMYLKRFYIKVEVRRTNPYLVMATALYLACKMEECPQHIRLVAGEARALWGAEQQNFDTGKLGECEFFLISEMNSQLIVHQPYRTLTSLQADFGLSQDEIALSWSIINDHYMTDLPLIYPPHIIALTAVMFSLTLRPGFPGSSNTSAAAVAAAAVAGSNGGISIAAATAALQQAQARAAMAGGSTPTTPGTPGSLTPQGMITSMMMQQTQGESSQEKRAPDPRVIKVQRFAHWLAESDIDVEAMIDATQEMMSFYECHENYSERDTREQIQRYIKARGLDK